MSELIGVLQRGYHESPLGYDNLGWFVDEVLKLENIMAFYFKNTNKDILLTQDDEEDYRNSIICRFCERNFESDKAGDHCQITGIYTGRAHNKPKNKVTQKESNIYTICFSQSQ